METLVKIDPKKHMYRWYSVGIQNTLVDGIAVIYGWGSLKSSFQQWRVIQVKSVNDAENIIFGMVKAKLKKGYIKKMGILATCNNYPYSHYTVFL